MTKVQQEARIRELATFTKKLANELARLRLRLKELERRVRTN